MSDLQNEFYKDDEKNPLYLHHSVQNLYQKLKKKYDKETIKEFLEQQRTYTLHKNSTKKNNLRNPYQNVYSRDQIWEIDIAMLPQLSSANSGYSLLLVCIDIFSRFAFVRPLRTKHSREIVKALLDIFKSTNRKPYMIQSDAGTEFTGKDMKYFLQNEGIKFRIPRTTLPAKAAVVESFNKTLKQKINRYLDWKKITNQPNEKRYIDDLQMIINDYNNTVHTRIRAKPIDVKKENSAEFYHKQKLLFEKKFKNELKKKQISKIHEGDFVRVKRKRKLFEKGFTKPIWSEEIFIVNKLIKRKPFIVFEIKDLNGKIIDGKLYEREIQKITLPLSTPIEILKKPTIFEPKKKYKVRQLDNKEVEMDVIKDKVSNAFDVMLKLLKK